MINLKGEYTISIPLQTMFLNTQINIKGTNLITFAGESFFMNRWINNEFKPIQYIVLGKGTARPLRGDITLGSETVRKECSGKVNLTTKKLELTCDMTAREVLGTTEIGVANDEILISHDIYREISSTLLGDATSIVHINYSFSLVTGSIRSDWKAYNGTYYVYEPNHIKGVVESDSGSGYMQVDSFDNLIAGSYFYNIQTKNLFIKPIKNVDPNDIKLIVQTK